jgi:hypothetical protein
LTLGKFKLSATGQTPFYGEYPLPGGSVLSQGGGATGVQVADWLGTIRAAYSYSGGSYEWSSAHAPFGETYVTTAGYTEGFAGEAREMATQATAYTGSRSVHFAHRKAAGSVPTQREWPPPIQAIRRAGTDMFTY